MVGQHKFIRYFLSGEFWAPWAKLTFAAYIIHLLIFFYYYGSIRIASAFEHTPILWIFFATVVLSYMISVPVSLAFEAPYLHIEKLFIFKDKDDKHHYNELRKTIQEDNFESEDSTGDSDKLEIREEKKSDYRIN